MSLAVGERLESRTAMAADTITMVQPVYSGSASFFGAIGDEPTGGRDVDFYAFRVAAGARMTIDINARSLPQRSTLDSFVRLFDQFGRQVAWNDDAWGSFDSYLSIGGLTGGTYFVGVSGFGNSIYNPLWANSGFWGSTGIYSLIVNIEGGFVPPPAPTPTPIPTPTPTPGFPAPTWSSTFGWGFVDASAAVARFTGRPAPYPAVPDLGGVQSANDMINAPEVWAQGITGRGVTVAVVDTGVDYNHPDLRSNVWVNPREIPGDGRDNDGNGFVDDVRGWDFVGNDNAPMDEIDLRVINDVQGNRGHGTHVAGTIAAANNGIGGTGVAPDARIMPIRVLDARGNGSGTAIGRGIRYAVDIGAQVINVSLGGSFDRTIDAAIRYASGRGVVVVIASGNDGRSSPGFPATLATLPHVFSVGAVDRSGAIASFSNRAGTSDRVKHVSAPGVSIQSTLPLAGAGRDYNVRTGVLQNVNGYGPMSGTSMACPAVVGVAARLLSADRETLRRKRDQVRSDAIARAVLSSGVGRGFPPTFEGSGLPLP